LAGASAGPFTPGNLAIVQADASANNTTASVIELLPSAANPSPSNIIAIDGTTLPNALRFSGSASSTLYTANSADGSLFTFTGHNSTTTGVNANTLTARAVAMLNAAGTFTLATTYTGTGGNQTRCATTLNNSDWFIGDQGGLYTNGTTTPSFVASLRGMKAFGSTVYALQTAGTVVSTIAAPNASSVTGLPGLASNATAQDFYFISSGNNGVYDVLYILSATSNTAGTIAKFSLVSDAWVANGTFITSFGGFGLAAAVNASGAYLYVTTGLGALAANNVLRLTDTAGYNADVTINTGDNLTLYTAPAGKIVKGVAFAPVAAAAQPDLTVSVAVPPTALANAQFDFTISASNTGGANASGVAIDFTVPAGLSFVSASGNNGFAGILDTGVVHFTGGSVNLGADATLAVKVSTATAGPYTAPTGAAVIDPGNTIAELNEGNNSSPAPATIQVLAASNDANLSNLVLGTGAFSPAFAAGVTNYVQVVPNSTATLTVTPTVAEATATVKVNDITVASGSPGADISLAEGINTISTVVTAGDGTTTKTYTAKIIRQSNVILGPGSIAFTGYNADVDDNLAFVALENIPVNTVIFFSDDEWNGTDWTDAAESAFAWTASTNIPAGTIVTLDTLNDIYAGTATSNLGTIIGIPDATNNPGVSASDEAISAFQGSGALNANGNMVPTAFLALIANEDPVGGVYSLEGTGLSEAAGTAIIFVDDDDGMRYKGPRNGLLNFASYLNLIADRATNWETVLGGDGTTYVPFSTAPFTAGPTVLVTINDVSVSEGDAGTTDLTFTVTRGNNAGAFTLQYDTADGSGLNGATVANNDYVAGTGTVTFTEGGPLTQPVTIVINGDTTPELNERLFVNLSNLVSTVGNAVISDAQGIGTILTDDPSPPLITTQPASQSIPIGGQASLSVAVEGFPVPTFQWYQGLTGDTASPVSGATSASFTTPVLLASTSYWVRASNSQGTADSNTANITVTSFATPYGSGNINILTRNGTSWNPAGVNVGGTQFVNLGLQGVGRVPASTIDPATGESVGSISDMQISGWCKNTDGSYSGTMNTLPDRGFNATSPTTIFSNYAARINSYAIHFTPYTSPAPTAAQNQIEMTFAGSTRLTYDHDGNPLTPPVFTTGLLANGGTSLFGTTVPVSTGASTQSDGTVTDRLTLDSEGLILDSRLGKTGSGWLGDEYGAYIYHFNNAKQIDGLVALPAALIPHATAGGPISFIDVPANVDGRRVNQGMEGIAQSPDGTRLFGLMQSATVQDSGSGNQGRFNTRLLVYDVSASDTPTDPIAQYVIQLPRIDDTGSTTNGTAVNRTGAQSCIVALNDHQLLILARDGNGRGVPGSASPVFKSILLADLSAATNIDGAYDAAGDAVAPLGVLAPAVTSISWTEALNMIGRLDSTLAEVEKFGLNLQGGNGDINTICEKWESIGLVSANDPANPTDYFLFIGNDNDFLTATGKYLDTNGVIQSYDAGLENDTLVLVYRVRFSGAFNQAPLVSNNIPNQTARAGVAYTFAFAANTFTDPEAGTLTYTARKADDSALPAWLSFNPATRTFSGTPAIGDLGTVALKVTATDNGTPNLSISAPFSLTVNPTVSITAASATEGNSGTVTLNLDVTRNTTDTAFTMNYAVTGGTATPGTDFVTLPAGTLTFTADGAATQTIAITVNGDTELESNETITVTLSGLVNNTGTTSIGTASASGTVINDDTIPLAFPPTNVQTSTLKSSIALAGAEIPAFDPLSRRAFASSNVGIQVVDLTNPSAPAYITTIAPASLGIPGLTSNDVTSVAVRKGVGPNPSVLAAAILSSPKTAPGYVVFLDAATGALLGSAQVGANPDNLSFTPDGTKVLVANEGEVDGGAAGNADVAADTTLGTVSIINVAGGFASPPVATADFTAYDSQVAALRAAGVRIFKNNAGVNAIPSRDFEPEYVAISPDGTQAMVTLQEANAVATLDIATATFTSIKPLGKKDFSPLRVDFSDRDGPAASALINPTTGNPVFGLYMPDAIASYSFGGQTYYVTANEGDDRNDFVDPDETTTVGAAGYVLDPTVFPNAATLKNNAVLGRLTVSNSLGLRGDTDGDGDIDEILSYGGRSFSILDSAGNRVFDSGDMLDLIVMSQHLSNYDDTRSDNKSVEPEGVTIAVLGGRTYAFITLERAHMVLMFDVTNPAAVTYTTAFKRAGDLNPEGLVVVSAADSPSGKALLITANEVSNTLTVFEIGSSDTVAPTLNLPANIIVAATSPAGAIVNYSASATDGGSGVASSSFTPASGSLFPVGTTIVHATATDFAGNTATGSFTVTVNLPGLAGNYVVLMTGANGTASLHVEFTAGHRVTGYIRLPNGKRLRLPNTIIPGSNTATLDLKGGYSLTLGFDGFGHLVASLNGPLGTFSGSGDLVVASVPPSLQGNYTAILEADDGAIGWLQITVTDEGAVRLAGKLPDGSSVLSGAGTNIERDGQVALMIVSNEPGHPQVSGSATFANLATSDLTGSSLTWTNAAGVSQGLVLSGAKVGAGPSGSLPLTIDGTGLNITGNVTLGTHSTFAPPVTSLGYTPSTGLFSISFRRSLPKGKIIQGSGVYQQKLGVAAGNFQLEDSAGRIVIGTLP
jgi:hypothetical protein